MVSIVVVALMASAAVLCVALRHYGGKWQDLTDVREAMEQPVIADDLVLYPYQVRSDTQKEACDTSREARTHTPTTTQRGLGGMGTTRPRLPCLTMTNLVVLLPCP